MFGVGVPSPGGVRPGAGTGHTRVWEAVPPPVRYRLDGDARVFLCFRTGWSDGRMMMLLVEDSEHPLDVVAVMLDDKRLSVAETLPEADDATA